MDAIEYIRRLTNIPSPSGYTYRVMEYLKDTLDNLGYKPDFTNKGGLLVEIKGENDSNKRLITAHVDTLGAMVKEIKEDGRLKLEKIGGYSFNSIEGENCIVHSEERDYSGTILIHQGSVHVYRDSNKLERNEENMEVRLDEVTRSKEDTLKLGISVGDFISFDPRTHVTDSGFIKSRHLDDKASGGILLSILEDIKKEGITLPYTSIFYFSNNEEIGYGANSNIDYDVREFLSVDMGALGDGQSSDEYTVSICAKDSSGPYNYILRKHLTKLARDNNIPYRVDIYPYYGSDASAALRSGHDIKHGLIGPGIESSHSYERTHRDSIKETEKLIRIYLQSKMP